MTYDVGTHIDLSYMNGSLQAVAPARAEEPRQYEVGTVFSFLKMAHGMIVTKITEPPIVLRVSLAA